PRPVAALFRTLPKGWGDALRQVVLFVCAYNAYQLVRGLVDGDQSLALANAMHIIHLERSLGAFFEPGLQQALLSHRWLIDLANFFYLDCHFILTTAFLVWMYLKRNESFYFVRNMFLVAMALALVGYALFPAAPPRGAARASVRAVPAELRDVRTADELRLYARTRLIESRLTPNGISLAGFALNLAAAGLVIGELFFLAGIAFIAGSVMDTLD